ncbi:MAG: putative toxin-antitoxin system toxin component, PIN family [Bacteroidia bacterium]
MPNKPDKLVIDTNLWISFLISNSFNKLDRLIETNKIILVFSDELLTEFIEVTSRPKLRKYFSTTDVTHLLNAIHAHAKFIHVKSKASACADPKDNFLLSLCEDSKADYLLTGDEALLTLQKYKRTSILKLAEYLKTRRD